MRIIKAEDYCYRGLYAMLHTSVQNHPSRCPQELAHCEEDDVLIGEDGGSRTASSRRAISALNRTWWAVGAGHDRDYFDVSAS